jgi:AcrR family transcriptional regulator
MPRTADHEERRASILAAFVRVAAREGLASVSLRAVAAEAGISLRLVQYYFETKAGLMQSGFMSLERESNRRWANRIAELPRPPTARLTLRALFEVALPTDEASREFHLLWVSYVILAQTDAGISGGTLIDGPNRIRQRIAAILAQGKDDGEFYPELNVEAEAAILLGLLHGFGTAVLIGQMTADTAQANLTHQIDRLSR